MRRLLAGLSSPPRRLAGTLVLALTLCACGRGGGGDAADPPDSTAQDVRTLESGGRPVATECSGPPPGIPRDILQGSWASFQAWLTLNSVAFADSTTDSTTNNVQLGADPRTVAMRIVSEVRMPCLGRDKLDSMRIAGIYVLQDSITVSDFRRQFAAGDSIYVFAGGTDSTATLAFKSGGNVGQAPAMAWKFRFCPDGHRRGKSQGKWRPFNQGRPRTPRSPGGEGPGTYGWMACASGCCQFYIPPPIGEDDDDRLGPGGRDPHPPCPGL